MRLQTLAASSILFAILSQSAPQPPTFRSGVDLLTVQVAVRDASGQPVPDLQPADFTVTIDGKPRQVQFARLLQSAPAPVVVGGAPIVPRHASNVESPSGRVVVFAVDTDSIGSGWGKPLLDSIDTMFEHLGAADAVGVARLPAATVKLSRDYTQAREQIRALSGTRPLVGYGSPMAALGSAAKMSFEEILAFTERPDRITRERVITRECWAKDQTPPNSADKPHSCIDDLNQQAKEMLQMYRAQMTTTLSSLIDLSSNLAQVRAPKDIVFISGGFPFDQDMLPRFNQLAFEAAKAHVTIHAVHVHQEELDASSWRNGETPFGGKSQTEGIATVASMNGGLFFTGSASGAGIFDRIATELRTTYQLGIETRAEDEDGKPHRASVKVARPNMTTRYAEAVVVTRTARGNPSELLDMALRQPTDQAELPLTVTSYTVVAADGTPRMLVSAEIGAIGGPAPVQWAVVLTQADKGIARTGGAVPPGPERPRVVSTTLAVPPGTYRMRVAAVDVEGRAGTLETVTTVGLRAADTARMSDLVVGVTADRQLEPRSHVAASDNLTAMLEVVSPGGAETLKGELQLIRGGTAVPALKVPLAVRAPSTGQAFATMEAETTIGDLAPGRYTVSAVIEAAGQPVGRVSRVIEITDAATAPSNATTPSREPSTAATGAASAADLMPRVGAYVERYGAEASVIIATETYTQHAMNATERQAFAPGFTGEIGINPRRAPSAPNPNLPGSSDPKGQTLVSEFALLRNRAAIGGWLAYRDVIAVNGKPVRDRRDRLQMLLKKDVPDTEEAKRITAESARFNYGPVTRTFNVPTAALFFFHPGNLSRFTFTRKGTERVEGIEAWRIDFQETRKPSLIMRADGADVMSTGTLWVTPADGAVIRTRLVLAGYRGPRSRAELDVTYRRDEALGMFVPAKMIERYLSGPAEVAGEATYADFKRFQTAVTIK